GDHCFPQERREPRALDPLPKDKSSRLPPLLQGHRRGHQAPRNKKGALRRPLRQAASGAQTVASAATITLTGVSTSACRCTMTSNSPVVRKAPSPSTTSDFSTGVPALVSASAMSRGPTEPYSLPSVEALT